MTPTMQAADADEFRYGYRMRKTESGWVQIPLTLEDVLFPQEGDTIVETPIHAIDRAYLADVCRRRLRGPRHVFATTDLQVDFGVPGLGHPCPDNGCFVGLREPPDLSAGILRLRESGGRCLALVEVVSPHTRSNDVDSKMLLYHQAGVPLYAIIDQAREGAPRRVRAFRWGPERLVEIEVPGGWLELEFLGLKLGVENGRAVCRDLATNEVIGDYQAIAAALDQADARRTEMEEEIELQVDRNQTLLQERDRAVTDRDREKARADDLASQLEKLREQLAQLKPPA